MNPLNAADQALLARLESITLVNGYFTDIGTRVHRKWVGSLLDDQDTVYPCLTLQPDESPAPLKGAGVWRFHLGRRVVALADPAQLDDSLSLLNDIAADLARCLHVDEGVPSPWGTPGPRQVIVKTINQFLPDREVPVGTVSVPVLMHVILPGE